MSPQSYLATLGRRVAAFTIDTLLLLPLVTLLAAAIDGPSDGEIEMEMAGALLLFVCYHWAGLSNRNFGFGRVVTGIAVVSLKSGSELTPLQCIARPVVRVVMLLTGGAIGLSLHEPLMLLMPLLVELTLLTFHPLRQTLADMICRTAVVNTPPMQPHRAPAVPMFSSNDAEFGPKPGKNGG